MTLELAFAPNEDPFVVVHGGFYRRWYSMINDISELEAAVARLPNGLGVHRIGASVVVRGFAHREDLMSLWGTSKNEKACPICQSRVGRGAAHARGDWGVRVP